MTHLDLLKKGAQLRAGIPKLTRLIANDSVKHFVNSFNIGGFEDTSYQRWPARRGEIRGGIARTRRRDAGSRALLVKSGDLKRSIRIKRIGFYYAAIGSDLAYAAIHNYGLEGNAFGRSRFKMPQRRFLGLSNKLNSLALRRIKSHVRSVFGKAVN